LQLKLDVIEIDAAIVSVATEWFGLKQDDRLNVCVADGLEFVQQLRTKGIINNHKK